MTKIDFDKMDGLAPAIVQADSDGEVLMVGFMNAESYEKTLATGYVTFYSRTRQKLWIKGETSGNRLAMVSAATDCDDDTILLPCTRRGRRPCLPRGNALVLHQATRSEQPRGNPGGLQVKLRLGIPKGSLQAVHHSVVWPSRLQDP